MIRPSRGRPQKQELTVAEAAALVQRSPHTIYRWLRDGRLRQTETTDGPRINIERLLSVAGRTRPGRPRVE